MTLSKNLLYAPDKTINISNYIAKLISMLCILHSNNNFILKNPTEYILTFY